jgi:hypothetical protein
VIQENGAALVRARQTIQQWQKLNHNNSASLTTFDPASLTATTAECERYVATSGSVDRGEEWRAKVELIKSAKHEADKLRETKDSLDHLSTFVNPTDSASKTHATIMGQLEEAKFKHITQYEKAKELNQRFVELVSSYSKIMNLLSLKFAYWEASLQAGGNKATDQE